MARKNYGRIFEELYKDSSPETRALFDNPSTRERASELYVAWQRTQRISRNRSKGIDIEAEARAKVYRELDDMFLGFLA